jgi:hypothetical protein
MIDIVRADQPAREFLQQVIFLICTLGGYQKTDCVGAVLRADIGQSLRCVLQRLVPEHGLQSAAGAQQWLPQPIGRVYEINAEATFHAQVAPVHRAVKSSRNPVDQVVAQVQIDLATDAAVRARSWYDSVWFDHVDLS